MHRIRLLLVVLLPVLLLVLPAQAQPVPRLVSYQGVLFNSGAPVTTATNVTFAFFSDAACTTAFPASGAWSQTLSITPDTEGVFSTLLGSTDPANAAFFGFAFDRALYLKTSIGGAQVACQALAAVPYALGLYGLRVEPETSTEGPNVIGGYSGNSVAAGVVGATIAGGGDPDLGGPPAPNAVTGGYGTVGGGAGNTASGELATVPGGFQNQAGGSTSLAAGNRAIVRDAAASGDADGDEGTFVWADSEDADFTSTGPDQFLLRASGGVGLNTNSPAAQLHLGGANGFADGLMLEAVEGDRATLYYLADAGLVFDSYRPSDERRLPLLLQPNGGEVGIGTNSPTSPLTVVGLVESTTGGFKFPDGTTQTTAAGAMSVWQLGGNAGTTPGTDFLGTTDNQPLEVQVNGARVMRYEPETSNDGPNVIGGASGNSVWAAVVGATISGGGDPSFGGTKPNAVTADYGTVGGGLGNTASADYATVGGGAENTASGSRATVGGGRDNTATNAYATVGGGIQNTASGDLATVGGGESNTASDFYTTVGGGQGNTATNAYATVGGGIQNTASGLYATVPGGNLNQAGGWYSYAAGRRAKVRDAAATGDTDGDEGTFLWADATIADFISTGPNQFRVRASGGTTFFSNTTATVGVSLAAGGNTWASVSDSTRKEGFLPADGERFLREIRQMRLGSWNYRGQEAARYRHYGPMAQDFHAAFGHDGVGVIGTDTTLATGDVDGVLFIAVQALAARTAALDEAQARIDAQQARIDGQQAEIDALRAQVAQVDQVQAEMARQQAEMAALRALVEGALRAEAPAETGEVTRAPRD